jgi:hypothetical protein
MYEKKLKIDEIGTVGGRINELVDLFCKGNKTAFGRAADIQSGVLAGIVGGRGSKPGFEILQKLLTAYPAVKPTWLLFGRGPMLKEGVIVPGPSQYQVPFPPQKEELEELVQQVVASQLALATPDDDTHTLKSLVSPELESVIRDMSHSRRRMREYRQERERIESDSKLDPEVRLIELERNQAALIQEEINMADLIEWRKDIHQQQARIDEEIKSTVFRVAGEADPSKPFSGLLSLRLGISEQAALQLVQASRIRSVEIEGEGYRVTEQAVRKFLGESN